MTKQEIDSIEYKHIINALRICHNPKGHRCSECPVFSKYDHKRCKQIVDMQAANAIQRLKETVSMMESDKINAEMNLEHLTSLLETVTDERDRAVAFIEYLDKNYSGYMSEYEKFSEWRGIQKAKDKIKKPNNPCYDCAESHDCPDDCYAKKAKEEQGNG